jgi:exonuclease SbcC
MRILAIRGRNLASLAEPFDIDFRSGPLAAAGLFAIAGPTGCGKSTLLDALCVALYDSTPRLNRAGTKGALPEVDGPIKPQDPRTLLRRGTAEGHAEVEFVGNDGHEYRATWSVRRARLRPGGKLQASEMRLVRLHDGQPIGNLKSEVLAEIAQRIGLSFEQFTRAVLLAQNEFAAFLKADEDERALLLQTLTGTDTFEAISRRAYERAKAEEQALAQLIKERDAHTPLDEAARRQLEQDRDAATQAVAALDKRKAELEGHARWHNDQMKLVQAQTQASAAHEKAVAAQSGAAELRGRLARVEAVQPARVQVAELDRCTGELVQAENVAKTAAESLTQAQTQQIRADQALAETRQMLSAAQAALAQESPRLDEAGALDAAIAATEPGYLKARELRDTEAKAKAEAETALAGKTGERQRTVQTHAQADEWLRGNAQLGELGENWPRWDALLGQASSASSTLGEAIESADAAAQTETAALKSHDQSLEDAAKADQEASQAEEALKATVTALSAFDSAALAQRRQEQEARSSALSAAERTWNALADALRRKQAQEQVTTDQGKVLAEAEAALKALQGERNTNQAAQSQARKSLEIAQRASGKDVEQMRSTLAQGEPCPVCGALDHPYATHDPKFDETLDGLRAEVSRLEQDGTRLAQNEAREKTRAETARARLAEANREQAQLAPQIAGATAQWSALPVAAAELDDIAPETRAAWFAQALGANHTLLETLGKEEAARRAAADARDAAQKTADAKRSTAALRGQSLEKAKGEAGQARSVAALKRQQLEAAKKTLDDLLGQIDPAFGEPPWRDEWRRNPPGFHALQRRFAGQWIAQRDALAAATSRLAVLDSELTGLRAQWAAAGQRFEAAHQQFERADRELAAKRTQRNALFAGRPVAVVKAGLEQAIAAAAQVVEQRTLDATTAGRTHSRAAEACEQMNKQLGATRTKLAQSTTALDAWIARSNAANPSPQQPLDLPGLRTLLAYDAQWMAKTREDLQSLAHAVESAKAVLAERSAQFRAHEQARPTSDSLETIQTALATLATAIQTASARATELELGMRTDDARRSATATLGDAIGKQGARSKVWSQLDALIGSADGKKFRNFAQQVTLDVLLGFANRHLKGLARRYRLQRIEDTLSLLVVDQDMADEVRSVHSLSGGESFLVSLALALALASLSSQRVKVESLFIDEGFGSLDTETLRIAMDALDALQAHGRKVGVISHVPEMSERIATQIQVRRLSGCQSRVVVAAV